MDVLRLTEIGNFYCKMKVWGNVYGNLALVQKTPFSKKGVTHVLIALEGHDHKNPPNPFIFSIHPSIFCLTTPLTPIPRGQLHATR